MRDEFLERRAVTARPGGAGRLIAGSMLLAFLVGAGAIGWLGWRGGYDFGLGLIERPAATGTMNAAALPAVPKPDTTSPALAAEAQLVTRLDELGARLDKLDQAAEAASGNAARAEGLMVAFAARRMIERGMPLGYLEQQLRQRFGAEQPDAVTAVIATAHAPITLDQLSAQLDTLSDELAQAPASESGWQRVKRELAGLFIIRTESTPSPTPVSRLERAQTMLRAGRVDEAVAEVQRLPGAGTANGWIAAARRYAETQRALDRIEAAALLQPLLEDEGANKAAVPAPDVSPTAAPAA